MGVGPPQDQMDPRGRCSAARRSFDGRPDSRGSGVGGRLGDQDTKTLGRQADQDHHQLTRWQTGRTTDGNNIR